MATGLREKTSLIGEATGFVSSNNLTIHLSASTINVDANAVIYYQFKKKISNIMMSDEVELNRINNLMDWGVF